MIDDNNKQIKLNKTKKALDWILSCTIRLPFILVGFGLITSLICLIAFIADPQQTKLAFDYIAQLFDK